MGPPRLRHRLVGEQFALESSHDQRNHCLEQFLNNRSDDGRILNQSVYLSPNWQANTTIVSDKIPGLKTSAGESCPTKLSYIDFLPFKMATGITD